MKAHRGMKGMLFMLKGQMVARTAWMGKLNSFAREDGTEFKVISFSVATTRNYLQTKKVDGKVVLDENGKAVKYRESDFILCEARGRLAELVNEYFNIKDENGTLISRRLFLEGHIQVDKVTVEQGIEIEGIDQPVYVELEKTVTKFIVDNIEFLDSNPMKEKSSKVVKGVIKGKEANGEGKAKPKASTPKVQDTSYPVPEADLSQFNTFDPSTELSSSTDFVIEDDIELD